MANLFPSTILPDLGKTESHPSQPPLEFDICEKFLSQQKPSPSALLKMKMMSFSLPFFGHYWLQLSSTLLYVHPWWPNHTK